jgi:hypothetical protein
MAFPSFGNSAWMKPCERSTPTAFHFMAVAMDMQHRTPDKCGTGLKASVKSPLSFVLPVHDEAHPEPLNLQFVLSRRVSLDLVMEAGGDDPRTHG